MDFLSNRVHQSHHARTIRILIIDLLAILCNLSLFVQTSNIATTSTPPDASPSHGTLNSNGKTTTAHPQQGPFVRARRSTDLSGQTTFINKKSRCILGL